MKSIIVTRPTQSAASYKQIIGRAIRHGQKLTKTQSSDIQCPICGHITWTWFSSNAPCSYEGFCKHYVGWTDKETEIEIIFQKPMKRI